MHQNNTISSTGDVSVISSRLEKKEMTAINLKKEEEGKSRKKSNNSRFICPYCSREVVLIWVHGHYQCQKCKTVIESCCEPY